MICIIKRGKYITIIEALKINIQSNHQLVQRNLIMHGSISRWRTNSQKSRSRIRTTGCQSLVLKCILSFVKMVSGQTRVVYDDHVYAVVQRRGKATKKARAGLKVTPGEATDGCATFVFHKGKVAKNVQQLVRDMRRLMEPFTASHLKVI